jgi:hypothetical protein
MQLQYHTTAVCVCLSVQQTGSWLLVWQLACSVVLEAAQPHQLGTMLLSQQTQSA